MTNFQLERIKYMISQAEKQTYVQVGKGDAVILTDLLELAENDFKYKNFMEVIKTKAVKS